MDNGCPKCEKLRRESYPSTLHPPPLCIDCRLEQAEHDRDVAIKEWEQLKKEQEHAKRKTIQQK